jgi:hypothetical protein
MNGRKKEEKRTEEKGQIKVQNRNRKKTQRKKNK